MSDVIPCFFHSLAHSICEKNQLSLPLLSRLGDAAAPLLRGFFEKMVSRTWAAAHDNRTQLKIIYKRHRN
ncbi:MAG: hypothetical protein COY58_08110 [Gammaproteobacteria bacterium CG_4_10_14_0_8_um_filter_38_16]|nr:MAG: hypothetical protein COY58_08110 [Gammaproteobacteria bacterium CG_4_10_14_0_8_um_filter_38_16]PJA04292.1 MAG: hypothetical protein COX72_00885 [Gammaproteobacteria bacterium CG_4_10_14_0_2_um_filter_38_22]PJB11561.1 MAG: hypothetical protein CO120_00045 [Gammaproteobacteria bacterium CG_4_9_14_3_um_filter_38_9]